MVETTSAQLLNFFFQKIFPIHRLENARGLESDHDDPNLSQEIHSNLSKLTENQTPADLKVDMKGNDAEQITCGYRFKLIVY